LTFTPSLTDNSLLFYPNQSNLKLENADSFIIQNAFKARPGLILQGTGMNRKQA